jgi:hypothetical protein
VLVGLHSQDLSDAAYRSSSSWINAASLWYVGARIYIMMRIIDSCRILTRIGKAITTGEYDFSIDPYLLRFILICITSGPALKYLIKHSSTSAWNGLTGLGIYPPPWALFLTGCWTSWGSWGDPWGCSRAELALGGSGCWINGKIVVKCSLSLDVLTLLESPPCWVVDLFPGIYPPPCGRLESV